MQISDEMMQSATAAYMKQTGAEQHQLDGWFEPAMRVALEAALSAAEPAGQVDASYGEGGMLVASFKPNTLPIGTKLYAAPPALTAQVQDVAVPEGWQLVPKDDESRCVADSALPHEMIEAGIRVQEQVNDDNCNYISGETTDWDCGMVAVAIYQDMLAAAPAKQEGKP